MGIGGLAKITFNGEEVGEEEGVRASPDGGVVVTLHTDSPPEASTPTAHYDNLVDRLDGQRLSTLANDLYDAIEADDRSRQTWLTNRARALELLGLELKQPKGDATGGVEGISTVTSPLMLEAILKGWANTVGELLPAEGPVKVVDRGDGEDELADILERDLNWWLTKVAKEYYPDTSHMILWGPYFGGSGFKKVYKCPLRRRPVSESVDPKDLIVSDAMKDLANCERITHVIEMRPSVLKRMQHVGAYRDIDLAEPSPTDSAVDQQIGAIQGTQRTPRPEDQPYTIWECQCELELDEFAPSALKGLSLPYLVTMDKDSHEILALRRDWAEEDEDAARKRLYVRYPFVPGPGFYGTGMAQILGNSTSAMTAAWREALDGGMYASFPGGFIDKNAARQNSSVFRMSPGEFAPVDTQGRPIQQVAMGMPYHDATPGLMSMIDRVSGAAEKLAGAPSIPTDEGVANVPVGSMLAQIEQATKVISAAHKGMHTAQAEEFEMLVDLIRDDPEGFIKAVSSGNPETPQSYWDNASLEAALSSRKLAPVSDPNVPSHVHRIMKAWAEMTVAQNPLFTPLVNTNEVLDDIWRALKVDGRRLTKSPEQIAQQPPPPPDPKIQVAQINAQAKQQAEGAKLQAKVAADQQTAQMKAALAEQTSGQKIGLEIQKADRQAGLEREQAAADIASEQERARADMAAAQAKAQAEMQRDNNEAALKERLALLDHGLKVEQTKAKIAGDKAAARQRTKAAPKGKQ